MKKMTAEERTKLARQAAMLVGTKKEGKSESPLRRRYMTRNTFPEGLRVFPNDGTWDGPRYPLSGSFNRWKVAAQS